MTHFFYIFFKLKQHAAKNTMEIVNQIFITKLKRYWFIKYFRIFKEFLSLKKYQKYISVKKIEIDVKK